MPTGTDTSQITLALVLTGAGTTVAATLIASVIEILKRLPTIGPALDAGRETLLATILAAILVVYAYVATATSIDPVGAFAAFLAWVGIAGLAGKAYDVVAAVKASTTS